MEDERETLWESVEIILKKTDGPQSKRREAGWFEHIMLCDYLNVLK